MTTLDGYWDFVPADEVYGVFAKIVVVSGFQSIRKGVLAKQANDEIIHLIKLEAYKGGIYGIMWGVSLNYVPHRWENELRWHRSIKSSVFDLSDELNHIPTNGT